MADPAIDTSQVGGSTPPPQQTTPGLPVTVAVPSFDTSKVPIINPSAQAAARHATTNANVQAATNGIAANPSAVLSISSAITNRSHTTVDPIAAHLAATDPSVNATLRPNAGTALNRVGTVTSALTMAANADLRLQAGDKTLGPALRAIVTKGGLFGDVGAKIDAIGQLLGANSVGEAEFWTAQPGVHDAIMHAHPSTPQGYAMQLLLGMHSDFARWKQGHPILTAMQTFGIGLMDPTAALTGMAVGKIAAPFGAAAKEFGTAASGAARTASTGAAALPREATVEPHTVTRREGGTTTSMTVTPAAAPGTPLGKVSPVAKAGAWVGRTFHQQAQALGPAYTQLSHTLSNDMFITGDRYGAVGSEYGAGGEWMHNKMVIDHTMVPMQVSMKMLSNDIFGGLNMKQKVDLVNAIEDLPNTMSGQKSVPPDHQVPIRGVSIHQRAQNWSALQMGQLNELKKFAPFTYRLMMQPEEYGQYEEGINQPFMGPNNPNQKMVGTAEPRSDVYGAAPHYDPTPGTSVTPLEVSNFFPHPTPKDFPGNRPQAGATGQQGAFGLNIKRRTRGTLAEQMKPQQVTDFTGKPTGARPGATLPGMKGKDDFHNLTWDPAKAATRKYIQVENYLQMMKHVHEGRGMISAKTGRPAVMDVDYHWKGSPEFAGATIEHNGAEHPLDRPIMLGSGQAAASTASDIADKIAPYWAQKRGTSVADARTQVLTELTSDFIKKYPTHLVNPGSILRTPDLDGLAIEGAWMRGVGDSNPVLTWLGTSSSVSSRLPQEAGEFTKFQSMKAFPSGTVSGVSPSDFQKLHFSGIEDDAMPQSRLLRFYDAFTAYVRMGKLFNPAYHPVFNVHPALTNLLLEHAGVNPAKILHYTGTLDASLVGAVTHSIPEAGKTAMQLLKGGHLMGHDPTIGEKWDVPQQWMKDAEHWLVNSRGAFGTGIPIDQYVHLFSSPWSELNIGEKAQRGFAGASQFNQNLTFNVMEARMTATAFHLLTEHEHIAPEVAARLVNKSINDYSNLTNMEREPWIQRVFWFYAFKKMMMRQAFTSLLKHANVLGTESRVVQNWNEEQGDPQAADHAIVIGKNADGTNHLMSTSMAPFRFGRDVAGISGIGVGGLGGSEQSAAAISLTLGSLAPGAEMGLRALMQAKHGAQHESMTPKPWDPFSGLFDTRQPFDVQVRQMLQTTQSVLEPIPMAPTPTQYSGSTPAQYGAMSIAATNLRNIQKYVAKNDDAHHRTMALVERLDNGDMTALPEAKAWYTKIEGILKRAKSGG